MSWNDNYLRDDTPWDMGHPSPVVQRLADAVLTAPADVLVPGCGLGHDAIALAQKGHRVVGADIAPAAIARNRARGAVGVDWQVLDALDPPEALLGAFDAIVEHTFYCALPDDLLDTYRDALHAMLRPGGIIFGAFLHFEGGGPPTGTNPDLLRARFGERFVIERLDPAEIMPNVGEPQLAAVFRKRG